MRLELLPGVRCLVASLPVVRSNDRYQLWLISINKCADGSEAAVAYIIFLPSAAWNITVEIFSGLAVYRFLASPMATRLHFNRAMLAVCCWSLYVGARHGQLRRHHYFTFRRNDRDIWSGQDTATDTTANRICWLAVAAAAAVDCCDGSRRYCRQKRLRRY